MRKLTTLSIIALATVLAVGVIATSVRPNALATRNGAGGAGDSGGNGNSQGTNNGVITSGGNALNAFGGLNTGIGCQANAFGTC